MKRCRFPAALVTGCLLLIAALQSGVHAKNFALDASPASTRLSAGRWINAHVPAGSLIGLINLPEPALVPPFDFARYQVAVIIKSPPVAGKPADYLVTVDSLPFDRAIVAQYRRVASFDGYESPLMPWFHRAPSHVNPPVSIYQYSPDNNL